MIFPKQGGKHPNQNGKGKKGIDYENRGQGIRRRIQWPKDLSPIDVKQVQKYAAVEDNEG